MPYLGLIYLVILVIALIDIINTDDAAVRGLPKFAWVILVVMLPEPSRVCRRLSNL